MVLRTNTLFSVNILASVDFLVCQVRPLAWQAKPRPNSISYLCHKVCSKFSGARKFCLGRALGQLTRNVKIDVSTLNLRGGVNFSPSRMTFGKGRYATLNVKNERNDE